MDTGFILLSRSILESNVFASQKLLKIWVWCLCKANFKDKTMPLKIGKGETIIKVKRGSFVFGRNKAEEELFIDGSTIYKSIQKLKELEMINIESNNQYSIITICNYNTYQDFENYKVSTKEQPKNNQRTTKEQPSNTTNTLNNDNTLNKFNYKNELLKVVSNKQLIDDYISLRKLKKAQLSKTALNLLLSECNKFNFSVEKALEISIERNWIGFKVSWVENISEKNFVDTGSIDWDKLLMQFNKITGRELLVVSDIAKKQLLERIKDGYTKDNILNSIYNCANNDWYKDKKHLITLEHISDIEHFSRYATK